MDSSGHPGFAVEVDNSVANLALAPFGAVADAATGYRGVYRDLIRICRDGRFGVNLLEPITDHHFEKLVRILPSGPGEAAA